MQQRTHGQITIPFRLVCQRGRHFHAHKAHVHDVRQLRSRKQLPIVRFCRKMIGVCVCFL